MKSYPKPIEKYIRDLYERRHEAKVIQRFELHGGNWQPKVKMCHDNVDTYVAHVNGFKAVRGWLYFDFPGLNFVQFLQHSVLESPEGELMEITPSEASQDYPFIRAHESDEEFFELDKYLINGNLYYVES